MNSIVMVMMAAVVSAAPAIDNYGTASAWQVYIGTYTGGESEGIYLLRMEKETGRLHGPELAGGVENPSFLASHPSLPVVYSVGQGRDTTGERSGMVSAFAIQPDSGQLTLLNQESSGGDGPCHLTVDRAGRHVLTAQYSAGSISVLPIAEDGSLRALRSVVQHEGSSVHPQRQQRPHAHAITLDQAGHFAFAIDLGLDQIKIYRYDEGTGGLEANNPPFAAVAPGAGPRHFTFHPTERFAYVVNELDNTVTAFTYNAEHGRLSAIQTITTLPEAFEEENTTAEIRVHPSGRFLYASNRGHDSIAAFGIDPETGRMTPLGQTSTLGKVPRNFNISPDGRFLLAANQQTGNVVVFRIDLDTGALEDTGYAVEVPAPVCVLFRPF